MLHKALPKTRRAALESALGGILAPVESHAGFISYVEGETGEVRFLSPFGDDILDAGLAARLAAALAPFKDELARRQREKQGRRDPEGAVPQLPDIIAGLVSTHGFTAAELKAAAFHWLRTKGIRLGNTAADGSGVVEHWAAAEESAPLLLFQVALDWGATYGAELKRSGGRRGDASACRPLNDTVLKVQGAAPHGPVAPDDLEICLAEYIVALDEETLARADVLRGMSNLGPTSYLIPLRGLGQWRAAAAWKAFDTAGGPGSPCGRLDAELGRQSSRLSRAALEEFFSLSLIDIFAYTVRRSLAFLSLRPQKSGEMIYEAFAILWNSKEVRFFKGGECVEVWGRDPQSAKLVPRPERVRAAPPAAEAERDPSAASGFLTCDARRHPELTTIRLDLRQLVRGPREEAERFRNDFPFDAVEYECYFFDADRDEVRRWADQLEDYLHQIAVEQVLRYRASDSERAEIYETIAHNCKNLLTQAGLGKARHTLREVMTIGKGDGRPLAEVYNTLSLLTVLEGSLGLLRLNGILQRSEYRRLKAWFTTDSLAVWDDPGQKQTVFEEYRDSVVHMARSIGTAVGHPLVEAVSNGRREMYSEPCYFQPGLLSFPPLAFFHMGEPAFALMPAVAEPLLNALRYLNEKKENAGGQWASEPVRLVIEDRRDGASPHILVRVGNRCDDGHFREPSGVRMTRRLMEKTKMATLISEEPEGDYRWVSVLLHPQKLYQKILREIEKS